MGITPSWLNRSIGATPSERQSAVEPRAADDDAVGAQRADGFDIARVADAAGREQLALIAGTSDPEHLAEVVSELQQAIEHHVEEEEGTVFPKMESNLGAAELDAIGAQVQEFKESA